MTSRNQASSDKSLSKSVTNRFTTDQNMSVSHDSTIAVCSGSGLKYVNCPVMDFDICVFDLSGGRLHKVNTIVIGSMYYNIFSQQLKQIHLQSELRI